LLRGHRGNPNEFVTYVNRISQRLNEDKHIGEHPDDNERSLCSPTTPFQAKINGVHHYPYVVVIEKNEERLAELVAAKKGTIWDYEKSR
jgi:hypothetical protein